MYTELLRAKQAGDGSDDLETQWRGRLLPKVESRVETKGRRHWTRLPREDASMFRGLKDTYLH